MPLETKTAELKDGLLRTAVVICGLCGLGGIALALSFGWVSDAPGRGAPGEYELRVHSKALAILGIGVIINSLCVFWMHKRLVMSEARETDRS
jgi:hypothetical protein